MDALVQSMQGKKHTGGIDTVDHHGDTPMVTLRLVLGVEPAQRSGARPAAQIDFDRIADLMPCVIELARYEPGKAVPHRIEQHPILAILGERNRRLHAAIAADGALPEEPLLRLIDEAVVVVIDFVHVATLVWRSVVLRAGDDRSVERVEADVPDFGDPQVAVERRPLPGALVRLRPGVLQAVNATVVGLDQLVIGAERHRAAIGVGCGPVGLVPDNLLPSAGGRIGGIRYESEETSVCEA